MPCWVARCLCVDSIALAALPSFEPNSGQHAEAVGLDEYSCPLALLGADFCAEVVVGAQEPLAIPAVLENDRLHLGHFGQIGSGLRVQPAAAGNRRQFTAGMNEEPGDENRLGDLAVLVGGGLERLAGVSESSSG